MRCDECGKADACPWAHDDRCVSGVRAQKRFLETLLPWLDLVIVGQTILLVWAFLMLGRLL